MFPSGLDVHFDVALLRAGESLPPRPKKPGPAANVKPSVTGVFKGNGKDAKLAHVSAHWREPFGDKPSIVLVFTEKDHSKDKKPDFNAGVRQVRQRIDRLAPRRRRHLWLRGGAQRASEHKTSARSARSRRTTSSIADGKVKGELTTDGQADMFGESGRSTSSLSRRLERFQKSFSPQLRKSPKQDATDKPATTEPTTELSEKPAAEARGRSTQRQGSGAYERCVDIEYKALVEQLGFKSKANVKSACAELTANLKAQGWTKQGSDLITPASAILKRKRGDAELTIFVKPESGGSEVKMMTEGLDWDEE